jgi:hypothetical protein
MICRQALIAGKSRSASGKFPSPRSPFSIPFSRDREAALDFLLA